MTVEILASAAQVRDARDEMRRRGIDCASSLAHRFLHKAGMSRSVPVGDRKKSWDVLKTVRFVGQHVRRDSPVLDIGTHACEILPILHRLGYSDLAGVDLDPRVRYMPHADAIRYIPSDFLAVPCPNAAFACVTAISVIEHGFDAPRLLAELGRILRPDGYFIASVDYWPEKIDTSEIRAYGMDWTIFSREELEDFVVQAETAGFGPVGPLHYEAGERVVAWMGKRYTFAWLAFRKRIDPDGSARKQGGVA